MIPFLSREFIAVSFAVSIAVSFHTCYFQYDTISKVFINTFTVLAMEHHDLQKCVRIDHGDILTFMVCQRFITVVERSKCIAKDNSLRLNSSHVIVREVIWGQLTHSQKHKAHTLMLLKI